MGDEGFDGRGIVAATYREVATELHAKARVLESQARAFSDAAQRIEDGGEPSPLQMDAGGDAADAMESAQEMVGRDEEGRLLDAVIAASKLPPTEIEQATLVPLANEAGLPVDRALALLRGWDRELVQTHRVGARMVVVPCEAAFARRGVPVPDVEEIHGTVLPHALGRRLG